MSALDKNVTWKNQPGDEIHKVFTVVRCPLTRILSNNITDTNLDCREIPVMKNFEYNWATAEMAKMYLRNSRAQEKRKARKATELSATTRNTPTTNPEPTAANGSAGGSDSDDSDSDDSDDDV